MKNLFFSLAFVLGCVSTVDAAPLKRPNFLKQPPKKSQPAKICVGGRCKLIPVGPVIPRPPGSR